MKSKFVDMPDLLLLHGALGSEGQLEPLKTVFKPYFNVHTHNFAGHGGRSTETTYSIQAFAVELIKKLREFKEPPLVFGYSMGGYVALFAASQNPELFGAIATFATKFTWTPESAGNEAALLDMDTLVRKHPEYVELLKERHYPASWETVLMSTAGMIREMGLNPPLNEKLLNHITLKVLLMVGDRDKSVSVEETARAKRSMSGASMTVLPDTAHSLERADYETIVYLVRKFYDLIRM
jgi:pimeloyl-ACP methyl ester carboxylesterase